MFQLNLSFQARSLFQSKNNFFFKNGKPSLKILTLPPMNSYPRLLLYRNRCPAAADEIQVYENQIGKVFL